MCSRLSRVFLQPVKSWPFPTPKPKFVTTWNVHLAMSVLRRLLEEVAHSVLLLGRRIRRRHPGWICEVEELSHIHLCGIALGEARNLKASFDYLQNSGVVCDSVRHELLLREGRHHQERNTVSRMVEVAVGAGLHRADISQIEIGGRYAVRRDCRMRRNRIVKTAAFIKRKNKYRVLPGG